MATPGKFFTWGQGGQMLTEDDIANRRALADELAAGAMDYSPIGHWSQGLNRVAQGLLAGLDYRAADKAAGENAEWNANATSPLIEALIGGGSSSSGGSSMPMPGAAGEISATAPSGGPQSYRDAIAGIESAGSGDYAAVGPTHPTLGRALGRYQVMEANIGPWSEAALGRAVTPEEFMASPEIQDAVFDNQFGQYVQKFGPEGAAQAWFGGEGGVGKLDRKDSLGTTIGAYGKKFTNAIGGAPEAIEAIAPSSPLPVEAMPLAPVDGIDVTAPTPGPVAPMSMLDPARADTPAQRLERPAPALPPATEIANAPAVAGPAPMPAQGVQVAGGGGRMQDYGEIIRQSLTVMNDPRADRNTQRVAQALFENAYGQQQAQQKLALEQQQAAQELARRQELAIELGIDPRYAQDKQLWEGATGAQFRDTPSAIQELQFRAREAGLQPGSPEYNQFMLSGGDKGLTINNEGAIPAGMQAVRDNAGRITRYEPIPGSPAAMEAEAAANKRGSLQEQTARSGGVVIEDIDRAVKTIEDSPNLTTGLIGSWLQNMGGTNANKVRGLLNTVKANASFDKLQQMRNASPTGGALGAVSDTELGLLQSAIGSLEQSNKSEDLVYNLRRVQEIYEDIINGKEAASAMRKQRGGGSGATSGNQTKSGVKWSLD